MSPLSTAEARRFYDRFGAKQDRQLWYEAAALDDLVLHADLENARSVFEVGCGTGRFALELLSSHLPSTATYFGIDLSSTMISLASQRLAGYSSRARVAIANGDPTLDIAPHSIDRFVSTYVLDLLPGPIIRQVLAEAHRVLEPGGLLCLAGITPGDTVISRVVMAIWRLAYSIRPSVVGGCRPMRLRKIVCEPEWVVGHHRVVVVKGVASEVLVASASSTAA